MSDPRPPKSPRKGKYNQIRIVFLNDTVHVFQVPVKGTGAGLWDAVVKHLHLLEADYFDLEYTNHHGDECWLEKDKSVLKQLGSPDVPLRFCVKFYTPDPGLLEDELTRFLFALQVRKDLLRGELRCSENTASLLASYVVQAEIGDFDPDEYGDPTYLTVFKFVPEHLQNHEFMSKVMDYHRQHIGESPSEADLNLLDTARKVELYGVKMWPAKDHESVSLNLAVAHLGVLVFQQHTKINTFSWAKVRKLSFKRKKFLIKLHADTYEHRFEGMQLTPTKSSRGYYKDTVEFFFETRDRCKLFWKRCIEHHAFFRCQMVSKTSRSKSRVVSRGSSFRYSGRTQKQLVEYVRENVGKRPYFERTSVSGRISSRSTSVTPKIMNRPGMHSSSADLQTSSGSRSSGSHILESNHTPNSGGIHSSSHSATRVESVDVHSDSSMSGSRSLNSPRLEHGLSIDQEVIEAVNARTEGAMTDDEDEVNNDELAERNEPEAEPRHHPHPHHPDPSRGMTHVSSDTKGADCVISPELHSPVRYVGVCSDLYSPPPLSSSEAATGESSGGATAEPCTAVVVTSSSLNAVNSEPCRKENKSALSAHDESSSKDDEGGFGRNVGEVNNGVRIKCNVNTSMSKSVAPVTNAHPADSTGQSKTNNTSSRSNLDLKLSTNTTSCSSTSSSSISVLTNDVTTTPHTKHSLLSNQHPRHLSSSPTFEKTSSSTHAVTSTTTSNTASTTITTTPTANTHHAHTPVSVKTPSTPTAPMSASQNANKKLGKLKSRSLSRDADVPSNQTLSHAGYEGDVKFNSLELKRSSSEKTARQVRCSEAGQQHEQKQQQQQQQSPASTAGVTVTDLSPPFPPPPPPLTPQQLEEEMRRRSLDASPSSCITDAAAQMQQNQQVRKSSTPTSKMFSLDSSIGNQASGMCSVQSTATAKNQQQQQSSIEGDVLPKKGGGTLEKNSKRKDQATGKSKAKHSDCKEESKKHLSNGQAVGAGVPSFPQLGHSESSRKLSAGTDLNEDIPYILRRRLDGHKEETAVFKASKAETRDKNLHSSDSQKEKEPVRSRRSETGGSKPPSDLKLKNVDTPQDGAKNRRSSERSPSLTRRVEFVYVNKLPSRNSYSSVDDTASPSKDEEILKQLEMSVSAKLDTEGRHRERESAKEGKEEEANSQQETQKDEKDDSEIENDVVKTSESVQLVDESKKESDAECEPTKKIVDSSAEEGKTSDELCKVSQTKPEIQTTENGASGSGHSVEKPTACKKPKHEESLDSLTKTRGSIDETSSEGVQFYSPKIPGTRIFRKVIRTSTSDDSPDSVQSPPHIRTSVSSSEFSDTRSNEAPSSSSSSIPTGKQQLQYFEVSKPKAHPSKENPPAPPSSASHSGKPVPKSLSLKTENSQVSSYALPAPNSTRSSQETSNKSSVNKEIDLDESGSSVDSSLHTQLPVGSSSEPSQFLIDLPSPAAALFYSDSSPPQTHDKNGSSSALTFSTFRPDPGDEAVGKLEESSAKERSKPSRWSLHSPVDLEDIPDFEVVMSEGAGIIEKSALKKRRHHDQGRPKEPKRVSWHDDGDVQYSYLSDVSMTAHRSPVEECDSALFSGMTTPVDSGDILETLENLRRQNSESDMTNSGSSLSSSEGSDIENEASAKQIYLQYANSKGLSHSSGDGGTMESDKIRGSGYGKGSSPLRCLESIPGLSSSGTSFTSTMEKRKSNLHDSSPLETLEHLSHLTVSDNFDDDDDAAGEDADDEDEEPNYPPPPPLMDLPDDMLVSYESDMPLPDFKEHPGYDPLDCLEGAASSSRGSSMVVAVYSSDSDNDTTTIGAHSWRDKRASVDPLAALELGDLVGNLNCTTSESESDFDADEANINLRSASSCEKEPALPASISTSSSSQKTAPPPLPKRSHHIQVSSSPSSSSSLSSTLASEFKSPSGSASTKKNAPPDVKKKGPPKVLSKPKHFQGLHPKTGLAPNSSNDITTTPTTTPTTTTSTSTHQHSSKPGVKSPPASSSSTTVISPRPLHGNPSPIQTDSRKNRRGIGVHPSSLSFTPASPSAAAATPNSQRSTITPSTPSSTTSPPSSTLQTPSSTHAPPAVKTKPKIVSPRQPQMGLGRHYERMRNDSRSSTSSSSSSLASLSTSVVQKTPTPPQPSPSPSSSSVSESKKQTAKEKLQQQQHQRFS